MPTAFGGIYSADKDPTVGGFAQSTYGAAAKIKAAQDPSFILAAQGQAIQNLLDLLHLGGIDLTWLDTAIAGIGEFLTNIFGDILNFDLVAAIESLFAAIKTATGIDLSWIADTFGKVWTLLNALFGDLVSFLFDPATAIQNFLTHLGEFGAEALNTLIAALNVLFGDILAVLTDPIGAINSFFALIKTLTGIDLSWISATFGKVWTFLTSLFGDLTTLFSNPLAALTHFFAQIKTLTGIDLTWIATAVSRVVNLFTALFGDFISVVMNPVTAIQNFFAKLQELLIKIPSALLSLTSLPLNDIGKWIDTNVTKPLVSALTNNPLAADLGTLGAWASKLLTNTSRVPAENIFGTISHAILGVIPVANIADTQPNLLTAGSFDLSSSVTEAGNWSWDSTQTATGTGGSLKVVCNGTAQEIFSTQAIPVTTGDKVVMSASIKTTSYVGSGTPIVLSLIPFVGTAQQSTVTVATTANHAGFTTITGTTYTVPAGVTSVIPRLSLTATATSGSVNFDDVSVTKTGLLQQSLVDKLLDAWNNMWKAAFGGTTPTNKTVDDILTAIGSITSTANTGSGNASSALQQLSTLLYNLLYSPSSNIGSIGGVVMDGVNTIGTFLYYLVQGLGQNLGGSVINVYTAASALNFTAGTATTTANGAATTASGANTKAQGTIDNIGKAVVGSGTNLDVSTVITNFAKFLVGGAQPLVKTAAVPSLDASILTSGKISSSRLPSGVSAVGSGLIMSRTTGAAAYTTVNGIMQLPTGFYNNVPVNTPDIQVVSTSGQVTHPGGGSWDTINVVGAKVLNAGWYMIELGYTLKGPYFGYDWLFTPMISKTITPAFYKSGTCVFHRVISQFPQKSIGSTSAQATFIQYLSANEIIYPAYFWSNQDSVYSDTIITTTGSGTYGTYFGVSLLNRSLA